jgi:glycosyltransferase involved in cell wall biosynthesis
MRVGVFAGPQSSGGLTFEVGILSALSRLARQSRHEFVLLAPSVEIHNFLQQKLAGKNITIPIVTPTFEPALPPAIEARWRDNSFFKRILTDLGNYMGLGKSRDEQITKVIAPPTEKIVQTDEEVVQTMENLAYENGVQVIWFVDQTYNYVPDIPYFATLWDLQHRLQPFFPEVSSGGRWEHREKGLSTYLQRASMVIVGSHTAKAEVERFYGVPTERIRILPHPTPEFVLNPPLVDDNDVLRKFDLSNGYLFYPAQFWAHKNHVNILLALKLLGEKYGVHLNLVLVGKDGGNGKYIRRQIEDLNLTSQVKILGVVSQDELIALYRHALALTYVTFFGPDNLPPLEAFALDCPVIASSVQGAQEQLGNAALLVNPADPAEIAWAIYEIYHNAKLRATLVRHGKKRAARWNSDDFVREVFKILDTFEPFRRSWM